MRTLGFKSTPGAAFAIIAAVAMASCATAPRGQWVEGWFVQDLRVEGPTGTERYQVAYRAGKLRGSWEPAAAPPGDFAFYSGSLGATIYADSSCGKRYEDAPLTVLINHLLFGFSELETESQEEVVLSGRAGLERISTGRMDGVQVQVDLTVIKKGPGVFDLALIASPEQFLAARTDYESFRDAFAAEIRR